MFKGIEQWHSSLQHKGWANWGLICHWNQISIKALLANHFYNSFTFHTGNVLLFTVFLKMLFRYIFPTHNTSYTLRRYVLEAEKYRKNIHSVNYSVKTVHYEQNWFKKWPITNPIRSHQETNFEGFLRIISNGECQSRLGKFEDLASRKHYL